MHNCAVYRELFMSAVRGPPQVSRRRSLETQRRGHAKTAVVWSLNSIACGTMTGAGAGLYGWGLAARDMAEAAARRIREGAFAAVSVERRTVRRRPAPPFTTAALQQEAARRFGFGVGYTMRIAQALYEGIDLDGGRAGPAEVRAGITAASARIAGAVTAGSVGARGTVAAGSASVGGLQSDSVTARSVTATSVSAAGATARAVQAT